MVIGERMKTLFRDRRNTALTVTKYVTSGKAVTIAWLRRGFIIFENVDMGRKRPFIEGYYLLSDGGFAGFYLMLTTIYICCVY